MKVLIVGAGAVGNWFADVLGDTAQVTFFDLDADVATDSATRHNGRVISQDADESFDVVCLAVPISAVPASMSAHAPRAEQAVIDLSGHMAGPVEAMREAVPERERISLHPLFAPENAPGNVAAVVEGEGSIDEWVRNRLRAAGCTIVDTTVAEHDRAMESIQARAHTALLAYALAAEPVPEGFETPISAGLGELLDALLGGTPKVYAEIQTHFAGATDIAAAASELADADPAQFEALYLEASKRHFEAINDGR